MSILTDELEERYPVDQGAIMPLLDREQVALMQRRNYTAGAKRQRTPKELESMAATLNKYAGQDWEQDTAVNIIRHILEAGDNTRDNTSATSR